MTSFIYYGDVVHKRMRPKQHKLRYRVFSLLLDIDDLESLNENYKLLSYNRRTVYSIRDEDHGYGENISNWVQQELTAAGLSDSSKKVWMLCYPRILGYVFNPLTVFFCYRDNGSLGAILYEVHNTFNERHCYVLPVKENKPELIEQNCQKNFYVSPFVPADCSYRFLVREPKEKVSVIIEDKDSEGLLLVASFSGVKGQLNDRALLKTIFSYPLMSLKVIIGIHYEAIKLRFKGAPFFPHEPYKKQNKNPTKPLRQYKG